MFTYSALLTSFLAFAGALAAPRNLEKRACSYFYQPQLYRLSQAAPNTQVGPSTTPIVVRNDNTGKTDLFVDFRYVPANAYGCQLELDYKPGHNAIVDKQVGDPTVINVYRVSDGGNFPQAVTWDSTGPRTGPLLGTFHFPSGSELNSPVVKVIANFACDAIEVFRFTVADPNARGGVQLDEDLTSGLRISYSC